MITNRISLAVQWGECDPAGIIFYPQYFHYFDRASWELFAAVGLNLEVIRHEYGGIGIPLVDAQASFLYPCRPRDALVIASTIEEWREKTFVVSHVVHNGDTVAVKGREIRFWGEPHPDDPRRLRAVPVPPAVMARFER